MADKYYGVTTFMKNKIHRRSGHIAAVYKGVLLVWGGYRESNELYHGNDYHDTDELWMYNPDTEVWGRVDTKGDTPPRNSGSCAVLYDDCLYIFGGYHGKNEPGSMNGNSNQLYKLDLGTLTWEWLHPEGTQPLPCDKLIGWSYGGKLYFFGGFGPPPLVPISFQHTVDNSLLGAYPRGWNNQLVVYNPQLNKWEWPRTRGPVPSPRAAHAGDITGNKVFIFGGRYKDVRMNDLHCLDLDRMQWSGNLMKPFDLNPEGRSWHSFTFITKNKAFVYGGFNQASQVLCDCWLFDISSLHWQRYIQSEQIRKPRLWHKAQFMNNGDLVIVGGHRDNILILGPKEHAEELIVLSFMPKSLLRIAMDAVVKYRAELHSQWCTLPKHLQNILQEREKLSEVAGC